MPNPRSSATAYSATAMPATTAIGASARGGAYAENAYAAAAIAPPTTIAGSVGDRVGAGVDRPRSTPSDVGDLEAAADAGHDARGRQERLEDPRAGGHREPGQGVLDRAEEVHARQQHHDAGRDDQARRDVGRRRGDPDRDQRREEAAGDLLVEGRQPTPAHLPLQQVDEHRGRCGHQRRRASRRRAPARRRRPSRRAPR